MRGLVGREVHVLEVFFFSIFKIVCLSVVSSQIFPSYFRIISVEVMLILLGLLPMTMCFSLFSALRV